MSQENVEIVRSVYAAWDRGDFSAAEWAEPEIEFVIADGPVPASWTGIEGLNEAHRHFLSAWEDYHSSGRGKASGLEIGQAMSEGAALFSLRSGRVARIVPYFSREHALADVGLAE